MTTCSEDMEPGSSPGTYFETYFFWKRFEQFTVPHHYVFFTLYVPLGCCLLLLRALALLLLLLLVLIATTCSCSGSRRSERHQHSNHGCSMHCFAALLGRGLLIDQIKVTRRRSGGLGESSSVHQIEGGQQRPVQQLLQQEAQPKVLVSNHISEADFIAIASKFSARVVAMDYVERIPVIGRLMSVADPIYIGQVGNKQSVSLSADKVDDYKAAQRDKIRQAVVSTTRGTPAGKEAPAVLIFPEGVLTSGRTAVLRYQKFVFSLGLPVQPLAIRRRPGWLQRHLFPVAWDTVPATFLGNLFWMLFLPRCSYDVDVLPPMEQAEGESEAVFADRVQASTAAELGLIASRWGNRDKNAYVRSRKAPHRHRGKRPAHPQVWPDSPPGSPPTPARSVS